MSDQKQRILIVDDDENIAELISLYLAKDGYEPDLILLDIMLPGMDGYEVCTTIRSQSDTPIIMLSAKGETFDKVYGLKMGADDYIAKPFDSKELIARVAAVLRRSKGSSGSTSQNGEYVSFDNLIVNITNYSESSS